MVTCMSFSGLGLGFLWVGTQFVVSKKTTLIGIQRGRLHEPRHFLCSTSDTGSPLLLVLGEWGRAGVAVRGEWWWANAPSSIIDSSHTQRHQDWQPLARKAPGSDCVVSSFVTCLLSSLGFQILTDIIAWHQSRLANTMLFLKTDSVVTVKTWFFDFVKKEYSNNFSTLYDYTYIT